MERRWCARRVEGVNTPLDRQFGIASTTSPQKSRPAKSTDHFNNRTIRSKLLTHFCTCQRIEEVVEFHQRRLPTCINLTLCQMLKADQTFVLDICIVVIIAIDLTAMFTRSGSPRVSIRSWAIRKLHFQRLFLTIKVASKKSIQMSRRRLMRMSRAASCLSVALSSARRFLCS